MQVSGSFLVTSIVTTASITRVRAMALARKTRTRDHIRAR